MTTGHLKLYDRKKLEIAFHFARFCLTNIFRETNEGRKPKNGIAISDSSYDSSALKYRAAAECHLCTIG